MTTTGVPSDGAPEVTETRSQPSKYDVLDLARLPMAIMEGATQIVCYANAALCHLAGKSREEMIGRAFAEILPAGDQCLLLLNRVYHTGKSESHTEQVYADPHPLYWSYNVWPVRAEPIEDRPAGVMIQVTETAPFHRWVTGMNEALLLAVARQDELMEAAAVLNTKLQAEIKERKKAQDALLQSEILASTGRMAAIIAHEINNPLETVMSAVGIPDQQQR
jgi:nitrogen-specific signal transduction histidine kinase